MTGNDLISLGIVLGIEALSLVGPILTFIAVGLGIRWIIRGIARDLRERR